MKDRMFKYILLLIAFVYAVNTSAQEKNEQIQDNAEKNLIEFNYHLNNSLPPIFNNQSEKSVFGIENQPLKINHNAFQTNHINWDKTDRFAIDRDALQQYFRPRFYSIHKRDDNLFPEIHSEKFNFFAISHDANYGFEASTRLGLGMQWEVTDKLTIIGNPFVTSYFMPFDVNRRFSAGLNVMAIYQANDWLIMRLHGQYASNGVKNANALLAPQNSFGGDVLVKFSKAFGLGGGVQYINHAGKWTPQFYPVIHINTKKRNPLK